MGEKHLRALFFTLLLASSAALAEMPVNFIAYEEGFASSGQPTPEQIAALAEQGYERVIYLAFSDHDTSLAAEDRHVEASGMHFVQIPMIWNKPTMADFEIFSAVMSAGAKPKTLVHCQVNYRASTMSMLYRVVHQGVSVGDAKDAMNQVWTPTVEWRDFIFAVLEAHGIDSSCDACDWTPWQPEGNG